MGLKGITGSLQSGGLQSGTTDLDSRAARLGAYIVGAYNLARPILDLLIHLPVLYKGYGGPFNAVVV